MILIKVILLIAISVWTECVPSNRKNETEIMASFIQNTTKVLHPLSDRLVEAYVILIESSPDDLENHRTQYSIIKETISTLANISKKAKSIQINKYRNDPLTRYIRKIRSLANLLILDDKYQSVIKSLNAMMITITENNVPLYGTKINDSIIYNVSYDPDIEKIIATSQDSDELLYYWTKWRDINEPIFLKNFAEFIELVLKAADIMDVSPLKLWYLNMDSEVINYEMDNVMEQIKPFYQQIHAHIRKQLFEMFGRNVIDRSGTIPHHIFEKILIDGGGSNVFRAPFPEFKPDFDCYFANSHPEDLIHSANSFYLSLGFDTLPPEFWENRLRIRKQGNDSICETIVLDPTPNAYFFYCPEANFKQFLIDHQELGRVYYANEKRNTSPVFFDSYPLEFAVGKAVLLSASSLKHLTAINLAPICQSVNHTYEFHLNGLFSMAVDTIFRIQVNYVHNRLMHGILDGKISLRDINENYWRLMYDYVGVSPPVDRSNSKIDLPPSFFINLEENHFTRDFIAEILGYQFYHKLCKRNKYEDELHTCDFYGSRSAGSSLRAMMKMGSAKSFQETADIILQQRNKTLNGDDIFEYYAPLINWLQNENKETNENIGWN